MKKVLIVFLTTLLLFSTAYAEIDLSGMTYDELVQLKDQINIAIWNSAEWQEVEIPQGVWIVGEDIPEGTWAVKCSSSGDEALFGRGDELTENGKDVEFTSHSDHIWVYNPKHERYKEGNVTEYTFTAEAGMYVVVDDAFSRVVFTPYAGKQSLGFK